MSGEELKIKLESTGLSQAKIAELLGVIPQSLSQTFKADDVKSGLLEKLCQVLGKDMSFFYDIPSASSSTNKTESEVYKLWMEYMKLEEKRADFHNRMQDLFVKQKEG